MELELLAKARLAALRLLKVRPRSEAELRRRLADKGFGAGVVDGLVAELKSKKLLNDAQFAQYFVTDRMNMKPMGRRALLMELKAKGVEASVATQAVETASEGRSEFETALETARSRASQLKGLAPDAAKRRLFGFLNRRGFSADVIYKVVKEVTGSLDE